MARWDSPLFTVSSTDEMPLEALWTTIMTGAKAPTNVAVVQVKPQIAVLSKALSCPYFRKLNVEREATHGRTSDPRVNRYHRRQSSVFFPSRHLGNRWSRSSICLFHAPGDRPTTEKHHPF